MGLTQMRTHSVNQSNVVTNSMVVDPEYWTLKRLHMDVAFCSARETAPPLQPHHVSLFQS